MTGPLWHVVDTVAGVVYYPGHVEKWDAWAAYADKVTAFDEDVAGRFTVEQKAADGPWAYAVPEQAAPR